MVLVSEVIKAIRGLRADGLSVTVDYLGEHTTDEGEATANTAAYVALELFASSTKQ